MLTRSLKTRISRGPTDGIATFLRASRMLVLSLIFWSRLVKSFAQRPFGLCILTGCRPGAERNLAPVLQSSSPFQSLGPETDPDFIVSNQGLRSLASSPSAPETPLFVFRRTAGPGQSYLRRPSPHTFP